MRGKIIRNGVVLEPHEEAMILLLLRDGFNVELIKRSMNRGENTADLVLDGRYVWEMKSPQGAGRWVINNNIQEALNQSNRIILSFARLKRPEIKALREVEAIFNRTKSLREIILYKKDGGRVDFRK